MVPILSITSGADIVDNLLPVHADAVIGDGDGAGVLVEADPDFQIGVVLIKRAVGQGFETQLVAGVGSVGDQFAEKDFLVGIQGMGNQAQQLLHFGLKTKGFLVGFDGHGNRLLNGVHGLHPDMRSNGGISRRHPCELIQIQPRRPRLYKTLVAPAGQTCLLQDFAPRRALPGK